MVVGGSETDGVTVTGNATGGPPSGDVKFFVCAEGTDPCSSGGTAVGSGVALASKGSAEATATSAGFTPSEGPGTATVSALNTKATRTTTARLMLPVASVLRSGRRASSVKSTPSGANRGGWL